jgi:hypothetical protein
MNDPHYHYDNLIIGESECGGAGRLKLRDQWDQPREAPFLLIKSKFSRRNGRPPLEDNWDL